MSNHHTPKKPTEEQLAAMKDRLEVKGAGLAVKRKYHRGPAVGQPAGYIRGSGYIQVMVRGRHFQVHHVVWFLTHGEWPKQPLDHTDGNKLNNAPENLRLSDSSHNQRAYVKTKGAVGYRGVYFNEVRGKYYASAYVNDQKTYLGSYDTPDEAAIARDLYVYEEHNWPWEGLNEIGQEYILKHHPEWLDE